MLARWTRLAYGALTVPAIVLLAACGRSAPAIESGPPSERAPAAAPTSSSTIPTESAATTSPSARADLPASTASTAAASVAQYGEPDSLASSTATSLGTTSPNTPPSTGGGIVQGHVVRGPGVDPRSGGAGEGAQVPVAGDPLIARAGAATVATAVTGPDGSFAMNVPPGMVTVIESICGVSKAVQVNVGETVQITIIIPNSC